MIVDLHAYVGAWAFRHLPEGEPDALLRRLDRAGIDRALVAPLEAVLYKDPQQANRLLATRLRGRGDRLDPLVTLNPRLAGWEADWQWCREELAPSGLRLHPNYHGYRLADAESSRLVDAATAAECPVFVTVRVEDERVQHPLARVPAVPVSELAAVAQRHLATRFVFCGLRFAEVVSLVNQAPLANNFAVEISHLQHPLDALELLQKHLPAERILLGTGLPFLAPEAAVYKVVAARLTDPEKQAILGGNAAAYRRLDL